MFALVGIPGLILILVILLILYGPKRLPQTARGLRKGGREFKKEITAKNEPLPDSEATAARKRDIVT
jgi:sec-independent protein translocase protein TatA